MGNNENPVVGHGDKLYAATALNDFDSGYYVCEDGQECKFQLSLLKGSNVYKVLVDIPDVHRWTLAPPYLYLVRVEVLLVDVVLDRAKKQFGMRSFHQDTVSEKKSMFWFPGSMSPQPTARSTPTVTWCSPNRKISSRAASTSSSSITPIG